MLIGHGESMGFSSSVVDSVKDVENWLSSDSLIKYFYYNLKVLLWFYFLVQTLNVQNVKLLIGFNLVILVNEEEIITLHSIHLKQSLWTIRMKNLKLEVRNPLCSVC